MNKWLVTAFEPFGGAQTNSSLIVLNELRKETSQDRIQFFAPVVVEFKRAWPQVEAILRSDPDIVGVLALGQAESRQKISLERVALNWIDARIADNAKELPGQGPVQSGPNMHWSNIPWEDFPLSTHVARSYSAGTYVCNAFMYSSLEWAINQQKKAGFVHLPVLTSQTDPAFAGFPKLDDQTAIQEISRILEYVLSL